MKYTLIIAFSWLALCLLWGCSTVKPVEHASYDVIQEEQDPSVGWGVTPDPTLLPDAPAAPGKNRLQPFRQLLKNPARKDAEWTVPQPSHPDTSVAKPAPENKQDEVPQKTEVVGVIAFLFALLSTTGGFWMLFTATLSGGLIAWCVLLALLALPLGLISLIRAYRKPEKFKRKGLAIAALVLSSVSLALLMILAVVTALASIS